MSISQAPVGIIPFGEFEADLRSRELRRQGIGLRLPDQSFQVLVMLLERKGQLVAREEIQKKLWPGETFVDFDHGLNNAVNRLREALGDSADVPRFVETLPRRGYRFVGAVNVSESGEQTPTICIPTGTKESGPRPSEPSNVRRIPIFWIATGTALLTVLTGLTFHVTQRGPWFGTVRSAPIHSIAVLPLQNLTGDPGQEYFVDGMTEALPVRSALGLSPRVMSRLKFMRAISKVSSL